MPPEAVGVPDLPKPT